MNKTFSFLKVLKVDIFMKHVLPRITVVNIGNYKMKIQIKMSMKWLMK